MALNMATNSSVDMLSTGQQVQQADICSGHEFSRSAVTWEVGRLTIDSGPFTMVELEGIIEGLYRNATTGPFLPATGQNN